VLEKIQEEAQGNANIRERFYGAFSSTPVIAFSTLMKLKNHHLPKLNQGRKIDFEKMIQVIIDEIDSDGVPAHLSLDDQSRFAIGYYHQRQDLFTKKDKNN
jgi:CRISPR-associated protein Csd1